MGQVINLQADTFRPIDFNMPSDKARTAHGDYRMATILLTWAQEARQTALRGTMTSPQRLRLLEAVAAIADHPKVC